MSYVSLLLLRHGKSPFPDGVRDFKRPLDGSGKRDAQRMGHYLKTNNLQPDLVVSSPARRAIETAEKCVKAAGLTTGIIRKDERIYNADLGELLQIVREHHRVGRRLMIVGHNPGITALRDRLIDNDSTPPMAPASLAQIELADAGATLAAMIWPDDLPRTFKREGARGAEERKRPAYYYTQSGVIPFRVHGGQVEILLIAKIGKKKAGKPKWGIPKGIVEPGMTPQASAAKEAREEAGVMGAVGADSLGEYTIDKWGGTCHIAVYPLHVTEEFDEDDAAWENHKRERRWFAADEAQEHIRHDALVPMIDGLLARYMKVLE